LFLLFEAFQGIDKNKLSAGELEFFKLGNPQVGTDS
jgi:hypothetical protein